MTKRLARYIFTAMVMLLLLSGCTDDRNSETYMAKPVIYLYPEETTDVTVALDCAGRLTCTYPAYGEGWSVTANPEARL